MAKEIKKKIIYGRKCPLEHFCTLSQKYGNKIHLALEPIKLVRSLVDRREYFFRSLGNQRVLPCSENLVDPRIVTAVPLVFPPRFSFLGYLRRQSPTSLPVARMYVPDFVIIYDGASGKWPRRKLDEDFVVLGKKNGSMQGWKWEQD